MAELTRVFHGDFRGDSRNARGQTRKETGQREGSKGGEEKRKIGNLPVLQGNQILRRGGGKDP